MATRSILSFFQPQEPGAAPVPPRMPKPLRQRAATAQEDAVNGSAANVTANAPEPVPKRPARASPVPEQPEQVPDQANIEDVAEAPGEEEEAQAESEQQEREPTPEPEEPAIVYDFHGEGQQC